MATTYLSAHYITRDGWCYNVGTETLHHSDCKSKSYPKHSSLWIRGFSANHLKCGACNERPPFNLALAIQLSSDLKK